MTNEFFRENIDFIRQQSLDILLQHDIKWRLTNEINVFSEKLVSHYATSC